MNLGLSRIKLNKLSLQVVALLVPFPYIAQHHQMLSNMAHMSAEGWLPDELRLHLHHLPLHQLVRGAAVRAQHLPRLGRRQPRQLQHVRHQRRHQLRGEPVNHNPHWGCHTFLNYLLRLDIIALILTL